MMKQEGAVHPLDGGEDFGQSDVSAINRTSASRRLGGRWVTHGHAWRWLALVTAGLILLGVLTVGLLEPLSLRRFPDVIPTDQPLATALGTDQAGALRFVIPVALAFAVFALAVWLAVGIAGRAAFALVLAGTLASSAVLLPINPVGAQDIYHNIADARTAWIYGDNPTVIPPNGYVGDPIVARVPAWQDFPSVYGPVWYIVSGLPLPFAGDDLWANVLGQKALTAAFLFATTLLVMLAAGRIRPGGAAAAGVLVGWNPLLQFETAGNAHNDVVMVAFAVAALYAVTRRWWLAVFPLLALSVATKYVLILLGPVLLVWLLRRRDVPRRQVGLSLLLGAAVGALVYVPFFTGADTLDAVRRQTGYNTSSPSALLDAWLWTRVTFDPVESSKLMKLIVVPPFLAAYGWLLWRIPRDAGLVALVRACYWAVFLLLVIATWWFWPWYLLFLVPLGALLPGSRTGITALVFSAAAMLMYTAYFWLLYNDGMVLQAATAATAFLPPVLVALTPRLRRRPRAAQPVGALAGD